MNPNQLSLRIGSVACALASLFTFFDLEAQTFQECNVDFSLLESQETFDSHDNGREYVLNMKSVPDYHIESVPKQTYEELIAELTEKLKDNRDYNKGNQHVQDSLLAHYNEMACRTGVMLFWWERLRPATEEELKQFERRTKEYEKKASVGFHDIPGGGTDYGKYWDSALAKPCMVDDSTKVDAGSLYRKKQRRVRSDLPLFWTQPKDSTLRVAAEKRQYSFPIGVTPVFDFEPWKKSVFVLRNEEQGIYSSQWKKLEFLVDGVQKLTVYNFKSNQGSYKPTTDASVDIFYDRKKLVKIQEVLASLQSTPVVIQERGREFIRPTITGYEFNYTSVTLQVASDGTTQSLTFNGHLDPNFNYDEGWPDRRARLLFDFPIYNADCYEKAIEQFKSLKLPPDAVTDAALKQKLMSAISSSPDWQDFQVVRLILTDKSRWAIVTNRYTGLRESRFMLADVYVKSKVSGKCYLQQEVYFSQGADPFDGFIYSTFVSVPQTLQPYPCDLK